MEKIQATVVGYGNVGRFALEALEASPDFEVAGIVRRNGNANLPLELTNYKVVKDIKELGKVNMPSRSCLWALTRWIRLTSILRSWITAVS